VSGRSVVFLLFVTLASWSIHPTVANDRAPDAKGVFSLQLENDLVENTDRHYTHGTRFSYLTHEGDIPDNVNDAADALPLFDSSGRKRASFILGQNMYTPSNISLRDPPPTDRPYAGWLYGGVGLVSDTGSRLDTLELDLGIVGPQSYAEDTQKFVHHFIGAKQPQGWNHQLKNEPGVVLTYERTWRGLAQSYPLDFAADLSPYAGGSVGNVFTHAAGGMILRIGRDLPDDYGPPLIRPSLPGSDFFVPTSGFGWYLFAGVEGRAVARNIFLDGNTFTDSASVDKRTWVGDFQYGIAMTIGATRIALTQINRTREFKGQQHPDSFGALTVGFRF
jgi:lipid A 3-O-deacylase